MDTNVEPNNEPHETVNIKAEGRAMLEQLGPMDMLGSVSYNEIDSVEGRTQQLRTSARVFKKMKYDLSIKKEEEKEEPKQPENLVVLKNEIKKAVCPLWTLEEKRLFFEALNEYGKDFENIHLYLSNRLKKKGIPEDMIKTKLQVRKFYSKTLNQIHNIVKFSDGVPKNVKELYALINFGEMRRKIGSLQKKYWSKLNELIYKGSISLRVKGKTIRVKTPMCRALRRLNQLDEKFDDLKLPSRVLVELKPKDMSSFLNVQNMAQNPRIRMALPLQKRLSSLLTCISNRWKSTEAVIYDNAIVPTNAVTKECVPDEVTIETNSSILNNILKLTPPPDAHIEIPTIDMSEYFSGQSICLTAFEARKGVKSKSSVDVKTEIGNKSPLKMEIMSDHEDKPSTSVTKVVDQAVNTILALKKVTKQLDEASSDDKKNVKLSQRNNLKFKEIARGWTLENCNSLTIGEMYLMFGSNSKLPLEYSWESPDIKSDVNPLSHSLKSLLSLARLNPNVNNCSKCSCGHTCGGASKSVGIQFKRPITNKVVKKHQMTRKNVILKMKTVVNGDSNSSGQSSRIKEESREEHNNLDPYDHCPTSPVTHLFTGLNVMQRLSPRFRNRRRPLSKQLVVERKLVPNKSETKHQIVSMDIIRQESSEAPALDNGPSSASVSERAPKCERREKTFTGVISDIPSNSNLSGAGLSRLLKESATQDGNQLDVGDYSLSSLLGHLEYTKTSSVTIGGEDTQLARHVDSLLLEASVDYTEQFAELAAQVVDEKSKSS